MTKEAALYNFFSSFGIPAYEENSVPDDAQLPYITYQVVTDSFTHPCALTASIWYRDSSWIAINAKAQQVAVKMPYVSGNILLFQGAPFAQNMTDNTDKLIKRKVLNIVAEYATAY